MLTLKGWGTAEGCEVVPEARYLTWSVYEGFVIVKLKTVKRRWWVKGSVWRWPYPFWQQASCLDRGHALWKLPHWQMLRLPRRAVDFEVAIVLMFWEGALGVGHLFSEQDDIRVGVCKRRASRIVNLVCSFTHDRVHVQSMDSKNALGWVQFMALHE